MKPTRLRYLLFILACCSGVASAENGRNVTTVTIYYIPMTTLTIHPYSKHDVVEKYNKKIIVCSRSIGAINDYISKVAVPGKLNHGSGKEINMRIYCRLERKNGALEEFGIGQDKERIFINGHIVKGGRQQLYDQIKALLRIEE